MDHPVDPHICYVVVFSVSCALISAIPQIWFDAFSVDCTLSSLLDSSDKN